MLQILVLAALCFEAHAGITLKECLDKEEKFSEEALDCDDIVPESVCEKLFAPAGGEAKAIVGKNDNDRPKNCYSDGTNQSDDFIKAATKTCPKYCGLCCKTAKFDCKDDETFDCDKVKKANQCKDPWKSQLNLVDKCPKTCGLCEEKNGDCQDKEPNCDETQCKNSDFQAAMKVNCKKTCNFCDEQTTAAADTTAPAETTTVAEETTASATTEPTTTPPCGNDPRCAKWVQNGFCTNTLYPEDYKIKYCGKACGKC
ncbi:unnamed protein product [Cylicocyclus nassatus]|uniref:ShKT domain-containing protein n=1 Tax=Cylicocyclus nassatus TaxID=53992 RepID=A0AA36DPS3_CYLNA|nr:unnamed protein product [Cylicocyclus nassatus]